MIATAKPRRGVLARREAWEGRLYVLPWVLGFLIFTIGPMLASVYFSFTEYSVLSGAEWVGVDNFAKILGNDRLFRLSLYNTIYFVALSVPLNLLISFLVALLLTINVRGINFYRTLYYLPVITPAVASSLTWSLLFSGEFGLVNAVLRSLGLPVFNWLFDPQITKLIFVIMGLWGIGGSVIIFLAGLQNVPRTLYEAASIDGANLWHRFRHITIPMMTPLIFFNLVLGIIGTFQVFTGAYIITAGGPANSTLFYVLYLYNNAFKFFKMGYASALAWLLFILILAFTLLQLRMARLWVFYEAER
ncbi:sugar ABC transporter permease [Chloroflexi bacterium TSY]|nr:sugar ABC transporter permease [Chloroflexi bacterium TSY]